MGGCAAPVWCLTAYTILLFLVSHGRLRSIASVAMLVLAIPAVLPFIAGRIADCAWLRSHEYLGDYVYRTVSVIDTVPEQQSSTLIVFERIPSSDQRFTAFVDGSCRLMAEQEFQRPAAEQGITLEEPRRPMSAIAPTAESQ